MVTTSTEAFCVTRIEYRALPTPFRALDSTLAAAANAFAAEIGSDARRFLDERHCDDYLLAATLNSVAVSDADGGRDAFVAALAGVAGRVPDLLVNVYECVGWAFLLRHALHKARAAGRQRRVLVQIVDADLHGVRAAWQTRTYGNARFGITSMTLEVDPSGGSQIDIGVTAVERSMMKFGSALRAAHRESPDAILAVPFFPEPTRGAFRKTIPDLPSLPDYHDEYGHCFGSDPWISMGRHRQDGGASTRYLVGSLGLSGYTGIVRVALAADARCSVERVS